MSVVIRGIGVSEITFNSMDSDTAASRFRNDPRGPL